MKFKTNDTTELGRIIMIRLWPNIYAINIVCAGSDGSLSASGSAGPGFDPRWGSKFLLENFQPRG